MSEAFDVVGLFHVGVEMNLDDPTKVKTVYYIDDATVIGNHDGGVAEFELGVAQQSMGIGEIRILF